MTNGKLGVLLVDVPEPIFFKYYPVKLVEYNVVEGIVSAKASNKIQQITLEDLK
ncbi:TPA: hypothetical protein U0826_001338 [Streptococcus suis]|uniref:hypothetical protein n=1 Tax=Streptococcus suis TaxID=1307 RepID=UPI002AA41733|nr:hypothetical protein [Streptococcus suis]